MMSNNGDHLRRRLKTQAHVHKLLNPQKTSVRGASFVTARSSKLTRVTMTSNSGDCCLPEELVIEILMRLPVKSLMRFRCVCRYWWSLIRNPTFISKHLGHNDDNPRLLVRHYDEGTEKYVLALFSDDGTFSCDSLPPLYRDLDTVTGPVNGLFCVSNMWGQLALCNPATRELRLLPMPPRLNFPPEITHCYSDYGLGLDPSTNTYKVVRIQYLWNKTSSLVTNPAIVSVYTLGTNSWRHLEVADLPSMRHFIAYSSDDNTYLNGVYYWLTCDCHGNFLIRSFDMENEVFSEISGLPGNRYSQQGYLSIYNDTLTMILSNVGHSRIYFDIWAMNEDGCWTKLSTIKPVSEIFWPLGFWKNGELLLETNNKELVLYDPCTNEMKDLGRRGGKDFPLQVFIYKESLVSVNGGYEGREGDDDLSAVVGIEDFFTNPPKGGMCGCGLCHRAASGYKPFEFGAVVLFVVLTLSLYFFASFRTM